ncbi:PKD domain-containing protein [Aliikangiella coralliicola]|uniref:YHYH protein n=1 Tax=Aliikangiella coralliicola TaxID=2592383 RepID=A0A545UF16_9GAMM|nr:PKD domain-containing protein [Aliikangiella coralliicola]TQV88067.1 YHYH protein [Aliikangiella coralliicola]
MMLSSCKVRSGKQTTRQVNLFSVPGIALVFSLIFVMSACGGGGGGSADDSDGGSDNGGGSANTLPVANAGADQNINLGAVVTLDGSGSSDQDGDALTYQWSINSAPNNSSATLSNDTNVSATFTPDVVGTYVIQLVVNDGTGNSTPDTVSIFVDATGNNAPVANAGSDQTVVIGDLVSLDGSGSSDADGDNLTYAWSFNSVPPNSNASLSDASLESPTFTADEVGDYVLQLVVNDGTQDSSPDTVIIAASSSQQNTPPVARAGDDKLTFIGNDLSLDGNDSSDADGDTLSYSWTLDEKPVDSNVSLINPDSAIPVLVPDAEGSYVVSLVVNDGTENSSSDSVIINVANWQINTSTRSNHIEENGEGVLVNVQSVLATRQNNEEFTSFTATGIPNYTVTITQDMIDKLDSRPNVNRDFKSPTQRTTAQVGDVIEFGQDINYDSDRTCDLGYWPPGPECPVLKNKDNKIPSSPKPATQTCQVGLGTVGVMLNGTSVFNWGDAMSYNDEGVWNNLAPKFEVYDVDICSGHAEVQGEYHHHTFSSCLQDLMGDDGSNHSPIYGFAADGYPIHGPYQMQGVLAKTAWVERDYDDPNSASGCGVAGERTCQLVDQYDLSKGTVNVTAGPTTSEELESISRNPIDAGEGVYFEDYYYDASLTAQGNEYLDQHNGHEHDNLGYHYHITVEDVNGTLTPVFPYQVGPTFYGELPSDGITSCE